MTPSTILPSGAGSLPTGDPTPETLGVCDRLGCCCLCVLCLSLKVSAVAAGRFEVFEGLAEEHSPRAVIVAAGPRLDSESTERRVVAGTGRRACSSAPPLHSWRRN